MPRKCLVCESKQIRELDESLVNNESNRSIANGFDLSPAAVQRHKNKSPPQTPVKGEEVVEATSLMDRVERMMVRCEMIAETGDQDRRLVAGYRGLTRAPRLP
jgi:hypothetical protein